LLAKISGPLHPKHRSGKSSQTLALGLLGVAEDEDPSLGWLFGALDLPAPKDATLRTRFEADLDASVLSEYPRTTAVDYLVDDASALICVESKWNEKGLGRRSCGEPIQLRAFARSVS
jgi:hypothetical protein